MCIFPIEVNGTRITTPSLDIHEGHARLREAILDGHIPISMPIGFSLSSPKSASFMNAIDRHTCCQESMIAVASNVSNIIFVGDMSEIVDTEEQVGTLTTGNVRWRSKGRYGCKPINPEQHMLTATEPMTVRFFMKKAAGYHSMAENAKSIGDDAYFPLNTNHTLINYVRVLPMVTDHIEVRYFNGMTPEMFTTIWNDAL